MTLLRGAIVESSVGSCKFVERHIEQEAPNEPSRIALSIAYTPFCRERMSALTVKGTVLHHGDGLNERRVAKPSCLGLPGGNKVRLVVEDDVIVR